MGVYQYCAFIYLCFINQILAINCMTKITECQHYGALLGSSNDLAKIVDATSKAAVTLQCRYCGESPKFGQKIKWFYKKRGSNVSAVELNTLNAGRIYIVADTLQLKSFDIDDNGIYSCHLANSDEDISSFTYVLDAVFKNYAGTDISGTYKQWKTYYKKYLAPINQQMITSGSPPYAYLRKSLFISFQIRTSWEDWGPCVSHNWNVTKSFRKKMGKCVLHPFPYYSNQETNVTQSSKILYLLNYFIYDNFDVSCHSIQLESLLPGIGKIVRMIPDFETIEECRGNKIIKTNRSESKGFKYVDSKHNSIKKIVENSHFTLTCPETSLESDVKWYKNGCYLNGSFRDNMAQQEEEPHLTIDSFNTLYLLHATKKEEGVYKCIVNNNRAHLFIIEVVTKSTLLNDEFIRYSIYLGLVLSLTMTCYCAGMCIAWHRRNSFIDPHHRSFRKGSQGQAYQE